MLNTLKDNRSLTFYQPYQDNERSFNPSLYSGGISSIAIANDVFVTSTATTGFNSQLNNYLIALNAERDRLAQKVQQGLAGDPSYTKARNNGVSLAWDYEAADVKMGGKGSENWSQAEQQEIVKNRPEVVNKPKIIDGKQEYPKSGVRGAEGHHQENVADHPSEQANPDNIKFYRSHDEHLQRGHDGDFRNETDGPLTDKNKMLEKTNSQRVFKNELTGLGIAVAIGAGVGLTIGFVVSLAQSGVSPESLKLAVIEGAKGGAEGGILSAVSYGIGRTIGELATKGAAGLLSNLGINISENIMKMCNMGVLGVLTITVFSVYQFIKLKHQGIATRDALIQVGKQTLFSLSLLAVAIAAQGIFGGPAGIIVSVSIGIIFITYSIADSIHTRVFSEKLQLYMIEKCYPAF